jgi:hypothetical protein
VLHSRPDISGRDQVNFAHKLNNPLCPHFRGVSASASTSRKSTPMWYGGARDTRTKKEL